MKSSSQMSQLIRAKKKKMLEDDSIDAGIPKDDLQDIEIERQNLSSEDLDHNEPKEFSEGSDMSNAAESEEETKEQPNHRDENANHQDNEKELLRNARKSRIAKLMRK